jgi:anti-anti-sigma regulatory factor
MRTLDAAAPPLTRRKPAVARVVVVEGDVDAIAAARLSASICSMGVERVVLDLTAVGEIDAAALAEVLLAARVVGMGMEVVLPPRGLARRLLHHLS